MCDGAQRFAAQVDREMNLTLVDVTCRALEGKAQELEFLYVKGRSVRCDLPFQYGLSFDSCTTCAAQYSASQLCLSSVQMQTRPVGLPGSVCRLVWCWC